MSIHDDASGCAWRRQWGLSFAVSIGGYMWRPEDSGEGPFRNGGCRNSKGVGVSTAQSIRRPAILGIRRFGQPIGSEIVGMYREFSPL